MERMGEVDDNNDDEVFAQNVGETSLKLPDVPIAGAKTVEQLQAETQCHDFVANVRSGESFAKPVDSRIYRHLSRDEEGNFYYNNKRISTRQGGDLRLLSLTRLQKNPDSREFLRYAGYEEQAATASEQGLERDEQTVAPEQAIAIESNIESFKITENWAKKGRKQKATRELQNTTDENEKQKLQDLIQRYEQMEIHARRRYNEVMQNQFKRINAIINDETKPLSERLRKLFRRDGLTIGALITAVGMIISTVFLAVMSTTTTTADTPAQPNKKTFVDTVKKKLVKIANWFLDLAKKALVSLPGLLGGLISFILKKAGEVVLFFSQHLIILFLVIIVFVVEITWNKMLRKK